MNGKIIKREFSIVLIFVFLLSLLGCNVKKEKVETKNAEGARKYYSNLEMIVPEGDPLYIAKASTGGLYVVTGDSDNSKAVWYVDEKDNWEKKYDINDILDIEDKSCKVFVSPDGEILAQYNNGDENDNPSYAFIDVEGKKSEIKVDLPIIEDEEEIEEDNLSELNRGLKLVKFVDKYIYMLDTDRGLIEVNKEDFSVKCVLKEELGCISDFSVYNKTLILVIDGMVAVESLDSNVDEEKMAQKFGPFFEETEQGTVNVSIDIDGGKLWCIAGDKISVLNLETDEFDIYKALGYKSGDRVKYQVANSDNVYTLVQNFSDSKVSLYRYFVDEGNGSASSDGSKALKIWTLEESVTFEVAVRCFTEKHPELDVQIEVGMGNFEDGVTEIDAIKKLNTEIMAGNGPDIIYMDGLDIDSYVESEQLYEISDVISELKSSGDYFNNILDSYNMDGKVYMVPSSVQLIGKVGTKDQIKASEDYNGFAKYIKENNSKHGIIHKDLVMDYVVNAYYRDIKNDLKQGTMDESKLKEFFDGAKAIYDVAGDKDNILDPVGLYFLANYSYGYDGSYEFIINYLGNVYTNPFSYEAMAKEIDGEFEFPAKDYEDCYLVRDCVAINANSKNIDLAKAYVKEALSEECQSLENGTAAFQVNKTALRSYNKKMYEQELLYESTNTDAVKSQSIDERIDDVIAHLESANKPMMIDMPFDHIVFDELNRYIQETTDRDTAVSNTLEKVKIYLAE